MDNDFVRDPGDFEQNDLNTSIEGKQASTFDNDSIITLHIEVGDFLFPDNATDDDYSSNNTSADTPTSEQNSTLMTANATIGGGGQKKDAEVLANTFRVYGTVLLVIFLAFCWLRRKFPKAYNLRKADSKVKLKQNAKFHHRFSFVSPDLQSHLANDTFGFFSWVWRLFSIPDTTFMEECGMDAWCFVRLCSMGLRLSLMGMFVSIWLFPVYKTTKDTPNQVEEATDDIIKEITTANVDEGSPRLVATAISCYVIFGYVMYMILEELKSFTAMRHRFLMKPKARNYAVYLRNIPVGFRSNSGLKNFFEKSLDGIKVEEAHICLIAKDLQGKVAEREKTLQLLEHAVAEEHEFGETPTHKIDKSLIPHLSVPGVSIPGLVGNDGEKVNSITYYTDQLKRQNQDITERIKTLREQAKQQPDDDKFEDEIEDTFDQSSNNNEKIELLGFLKHNTADLLSNAVKKPMAITNEATGLVTKATKDAANFVGLMDKDGTILSAAFVVFQTLSTANAALQMIHHEAPYQMEVIEAPDPEDIFWNNVGREHRDLQVGRLISFAAATAICLFWTIPVGFVATISSVEGLRQEFEFVDNLLVAAPWLKSVLEVLAPQFLVILNALLPMILGYITTFEGAVSGSLVEASLFVKLAAFMIIQTFFVTALSSSILQDIKELLESPGDIIGLLASSLPSQSTFFIQLSFVSTTTTFLMEGLGIVRLAKALARKFIGPHLTERERRMPVFGLNPLSEPIDFRHGDYLSNLVLLYMVLFVYSVIAPLVCYIIGFCFVILGALFRHQFVYVYGAKPDSGGMLWVNFIKLLTNCLLIAELTVSGLMALKEGVIAVPLMIPLLIITILFGIYIREKHFLVAMRLPTRLCLQQDRKTRHWVDFSFVRDAYLQPEMREKEAIPNVSRDRLRELGLGGDEEKEMVASPKNDFNSYQTTTPHGKCRVTRLNVPHDIVDEDKKRGEIPDDEEPELVVNIENDSPVESVATEGESVSSP